MVEEWTPLIERRKKQCANCGLLGQLRLADRELVPMLAEFRARDARGSGYLPFLKEQGGGYGGRPICAATARDFTAGSNFAEAYAMDFVHWRDMLAKPMPDCETFIQWVPGLSIRDHKEMLDRSRMLEWQAQREDADREWRAYQSEKDDQWRADQATAERVWRHDERRRDNRLRWAELTILGIGVIVAIAIGFGSGRGTTYVTLPPVATAVSQPTP